MLGVLPRNTGQVQVLKKWLLENGCNLDDKWWKIYQNQENEKKIFYR